MSFEDSQVNLNEEDLQSQSLAEVCIKMQEQIKNLSAEVKELKDRLSKVEEMETNAKLQEVKPCSNIDKATGNDTGALKDRIKTTNTITDDDKITSYADIVSGSQIVHKEDNVIVVQAEIHPNPTNDGGRSTSNKGNKGNGQGDNSDGSGGMSKSNTGNKGDAQCDNSDRSGGMSKSNTCNKFNGQCDNSDGFKMADQSYVLLPLIILMSKKMLHKLYV